MSRTFIVFLLVGLTSATLNWSSRFGFQHFMSFGNAVIAAYGVGMAIAYAGNRLFVFESSNRNAWEEMGRFSIVNISSLAIVWLVSTGLVDHVFPTIGFTWHTEALAHAIGLMSTAVSSYFGHRHFTFNKKVVRNA